MGSQKRVQGSRQDRCRHSQGQVPSVGGHRAAPTSSGPVTVGLNLHKQPAVPLYVFSSLLSVTPNTTSETPVFHPSGLRCINQLLNMGAVAVFLSNQVIKQKIVNDLSQNR